MLVHVGTLIGAGFIAASIDKDWKPEFPLINKKIFCEVLLNII